ncbi:hypothetical protein ACFSQ7_35525 [Paenibacillus rhizoplanae]
MDQLCEQYGLSIDSIRKIVYSKKTRRADLRVFAVYAQHGRYL